MFLFAATQINSRLEGKRTSELFQMRERQFNDFWEIRCPHCGESLDIEILMNLVKGRVPVRA